MLPLDVKEFIEQNIDKITDLNFESLYEDAVRVGGVYNVGQLTEALLQADINPLEYVTEIPSLYLDGADKATPSFVIPHNILRIKKAGFAFSNIQNIEIPDSCELSEGSFRSCSELTTIKIPAIMNEIPEECFYACISLKQVDLGDVEQIANESFAHCRNLRDIIIPDCIEYISDSAFYNSPYVRLVVSSDNDYAIHYANQNNIQVKVVDRV